MVEPEAELVQVTRQVLDVHRALVGGKQPPFGLGRDAVHSRQQLADVLAQGLGGALPAPIMGVADLVDAQVTGPSVGDHGGPWGDVVVMNVCSVRADPSGMTRIRHRPKPLGDLTSTATATSAFLPLARPPASPASSPPM